MEKEYQPISCTFYDRLEAAATLNKKVELKYYNEEKLLTISTTIISLEIKDKIEYMGLADGTEVRLDAIHSLDGVELKNHC